MLIKCRPILHLDYLQYSFLLNEPKADTPPPFYSTPVLRWHCGHNMELLPSSFPYLFDDNLQTHLRIQNKMKYSIRAGDGSIGEPLRVSL